MCPKIILEWDNVDDETRKYTYKTEDIDMSNWYEIWFAFAQALRSWLKDVRILLKQQKVAKKVDVVYNQIVKDIFNWLIK